MCSYNPSAARRGQCIAFDPGLKNLSRFRIFPLDGGRCVAYTPTIMANGKDEREGYTEAGHVLATAAGLKGWSLRKLAAATGIPTARLHRIAIGARLSYADGLRLEDVLGLERGRLDPAYREWRRAAR